MAALVERWAAFELADRYRMDAPPRREIRESGTVLREPATDEQIRATEERLGVRLPVDYRAFLLRSNGAYAWAGGIETAYYGGHGYVPVEDVGLAREVNPSWYDVWFPAGQQPWWPSLDDEGPTAPDDGFTVVDLGPMRDALVISRPAGTNMTLLVPRSNGRWQLWEAVWEGAYGYSSFAARLRFRLRNPWRKVPDARGVAALVEELTQRSGSWRRHNGFILLAEVDAPRLVELSRLILAVPGTTPEEELRLAEVLGRLHVDGVAGSLEVLHELAARPDDLQQATGLFGLAEADEPGVAQRLTELADRAGDRRVVHWCQLALTNMAAR